LQVQVQSRALQNSKGRKMMGGQHLNPVFQLPMKGECNKAGLPQLDTGMECFLPLTALAEGAQNICIFVAAGSGLAGSQRFQADCIELQSHSIKKQQGVYKCSATHGEHYLCLKVESHFAQVWRPVLAGASAKQPSQECAGIVWL
jgi:hypothetical protein